MIEEDSNEVRCWYYDACALEQEKIYEEIINKEHSISRIVSHLSLGEAFANCLRKGEEQIKAFIDFINKLYPDYLRLVGNDDIEK